MEAILSAIGRPTEKQEEFLEATNKYVCYGGVRGGGKSWAVRAKALSLAATYEGIRILIVSCEYFRTIYAIVEPMLAVLPAGSYSYSKVNGELSFANGSMIRFVSMCGRGLTSVAKFNRPGFDVIFIEGAENFSEQEFRGMTYMVVGANDFPKQVNLTWNPFGSPENLWIKQLFVDRKLKAGEDPNDYRFIDAASDSPLQERGG